MRDIKLGIVYDNFYNKVSVHGIKFRKMIKDPLEYLIRMREGCLITACLIDSAVAALIIFVIWEWPLHGNKTAIKFNIISRHKVLRNFELKIKSGSKKILKVCWGLELHCVFSVYPCRSTLFAKHRYIISKRPQGVVFMVSRGTLVHAHQQSLTLLSLLIYLVDARKPGQFRSRVPTLSEYMPKIPVISICSL